MHCNVHQALQCSFSIFHLWWLKSQHTCCLVSVCLCMCTYIDMVYIMQNCKVEGCTDQVTVWCCACTHFTGFVWTCWASLREDCNTHWVYCTSSAEDLWYWSGQCCHCFSDTDWYNRYCCYYSSLGSVLPYFLTVSNVYRIIILCVVYSAVPRFQQLSYYLY